MQQQKMYGQYFKENVYILPAGFSVTRKETICDQLIKQINCVQSVRHLLKLNSCFLPTRSVKTLTGSGLVSHLLVRVFLLKMPQP